MAKSPLDAARGEIRLLTILPFEGTNLETEVQHGDVLLEAEELHCRIDHYPLRDWRLHEEYDDNCSEMGCYVALSYTWGDPNDLDEIIIDGFAMPVQSNLKKALIALRRTDFLRSGCKVWADALCINQGDIAERSREIKRMRDIYKKCWNVVIWLGDSDTDSNDAIDFLNATYDLLSKGSEATREYFRDYLATSRGVTIWQSLSNLICRPYFSRLWIIQELAMGRLNTPILCGNNETTWEKMYQVYHGLHKDPSVSVNSEGPGNNHIAALLHEELVPRPKALHAYKNVQFWNWEKCEDFCVLQSQLSDTPSTFDIFQGVLLTRCRMSRCYDPRDKVYGMLALVKESLTEATTVDYGTDIPAVYTAFSRAWMEKHESLELLKHCGASGEHYLYDVRFPSWVVDLTQENRPLTGNYHPGFQAHGGMPASFTFRDAVLTAKGVLFDHVDGFSGVRNWRDDFNNYTDILSSSTPANPYGDNAAFQDALWRVLNENKDRMGDPVREAYPVILDSAILEPSCGPPGPEPTEFWTDNFFRWNWHLWVKRNANFMLGGKALRNWLVDNNAMKNDTSAYYAALARVEFTLWFRRLITTSRGYIGQATGPVNRGDVVAVLWGCSQPLLLREDSQHKGLTKKYRIIGVCYIQGIMNGEIVQELKSGGCVEEEIRIC